VSRRRVVSDRYLYRDIEKRNNLNKLNSLY